MTAPDLITTPFGFQSTAAEVIKDIDLSGKRAIVTGGSSGIGVETARALVHRDEPWAAGYTIASGIAFKTLYYVYEVVWQKVALDSDKRASWRVLPIGPDS